jgi:hypothetical protein
MGLLMPRPDYVLGVSNEVAEGYELLTEILSW